MMKMIVAKIEVEIYEDVKFKDSYKNCSEIDDEREIFEELEEFS